jgi:ribonuclease HI
VTSLVIFADGASRGNPGAAASGALVMDPSTGLVLVELGLRCGIASNNVAEYRGMIAGISVAKTRFAPESVLVKMDSKLVVEQMSGRWKVKHPDMRELVRHAWDVIGDWPVEFAWIPREDNSHADRLANRALDEGRDFEIHH